MSKIAFLLAMLLLAFAVTAEESVVESADSDNENDEIDMEQFSLSDDESDDEEDASPEATKAAQDAIDASVADFNDDVKIEDENEQKFIVEGSNEEFTFDGVSAEQIAAWKNDLYHNNAKVEIVSDESPAEAAVSDVEDEHSEDEAVVDDILDEIEKEARANDIAEEDVVEVEELGTNTVVPFSNEAEPEIEEMNEDEATGSQWKPVSTKSGNSWVKCKPARKTASSMTNGKSTKVNTRRVVTGGKGPNVCSRKYDADAATLAELIYRNQRVGSTPYKNYKVITIMNHKSSGSFGGVFVDSKQKLVVLAFRGTEKTSIKDWTVNFNTKKTGCPFGGCGRMHKGFAYSYSTMQAAAYNAVSKYRNQGYSLIITGHSLGGALATTAAMDYANRGGFSSMNIISIGAPRVGDSTFASAYNRKFPCSRRYVLQFRGGKCAIKDDDESEVQDMFFRRATRWGMLNSLHPLPVSPLFMCSPSFPSLPQFPRN
eukprot:TRINITY_DN2676_c0_g2_i2.p1 TRINITY_DN2676_c0_g2~~TRINITY_DN2676_c0_g2_i2.p1  ORF type:complete len:508 (-),score=170.91 TRINITY_DN2676_c0_g2_i2:25-1482(-)